MPSSVTIVSQTLGSADPIGWPRAAVFDCDGLLVDTEACWHCAYAAVACDVGADLSDLDLPALNGASVCDAASILTEAFGATVSATAIERALGHALTDRPVLAMPGAAALLQRIARASLPVAVASNAPVGILGLTLHRAGLAPFVPNQVSAETRGLYKPDPDVYRTACRTLGVDPSDALAFEDSVTGARSARAAGLAVIGVSTSPAIRQHVDLAIPRLDDPRVDELFRFGN